jgi:uncharacterized protein (TIGR02118 family)
MVRLFAYLYRNEELTHDQFVDHWQNRHGPLIASLPDLARHIVRYEQHPRHSPDVMSGSEGCDGVAVQWFESLDDFVAFVAEPDYAAHIAPDETRFLDMSRVRFVVCDAPRVVIDGEVAA